MITTIQNMIGISSADMVKGFFIDILFLVGLVVIAKKAWGKIYHWIETYRKKRNTHDIRNRTIEDNTKENEALRSTLGEHTEILVNMQNILMGIMHDRISQKCKYYLKTGFIHDDEYGYFTSSMAYYKNFLKGNHGLEKLYDKAIKLPLESVYIHSNVS